MRKRCLIKRVTAFSLAAVVVAVTILSYGGNIPFRGSVVNAEEKEHTSYIKKVQVSTKSDDPNEGASDAVILSWEYQEENMKELAAGEYTVKISSNKLEEEVEAGIIKVTKEECSGEPTEDSADVPLEEAVKEPIVEEKVMEESVVEEEVAEEAVVEEPVVEEAVSEEPIVEEIAAEEVVGELSAAVTVSGNEAEKGGNTTPVKESRKEEPSHPEPSQEVTMITTVHMEGAVNQYTIQNAKKKDASYKVSFCSKTDNKEIESIGKEYKAAAKITFKIEGKGIVYYNGRNYTSEEEVVLEPDNRTFGIVPEKGWRLNKDILSKDTKGAVISEEISADEKRKYTVSNVTEDVEVPIFFIEKLKIPELSDTKPAEDLELSENKENPSVYKEPFSIKMKKREGVHYKYTLDGSDPRTSASSIEYEDSITIDSYEKSVTLKVYAYAENKDNSDVKEWYCKLIPKAPDVINENIEFSTETVVTDHNYIETKNGKSQIKVRQEALSSNKYLLELGLDKGRDGTYETWIDSSEYKEGCYYFLLPSNLSTGTYKTGVRYQTKGGNVSEVKATSQSFETDNDLPEITVSAKADTDSEKGRTINSPGWVNHDVTFHVNSDAVSGILTNEYTTDETNFIPMEDGKSTVTIPIADISEEGSNYSFRAISKVGHIGQNSSEILVKKDMMPPDALSDENVTVEGLEESAEDKGNTIYTQEVPIITVQDVPTNETGTNSLLTTKYRIDKIQYPNVTNQGTMKNLIDRTISLPEMGRYQVCFWNEDEAGNLSQKYEKEICYDNAAPEICSDPRFALEGDKKETGYADYRFFAKSGLKFKFSAKDEQSGLSKIIIKNGNSIIKETRLNGETQATDFEIGISEEGRYQLSVSVFDKSGQELNIQSTVEGFIIDSSGPQVQIDSDKQEEEWQKEDINFSVTASDPGSGIRKTIVTLNGKATEKTASAYQETSQIQITATDEAENSEGYLLKVEAVNNAEDKQTMEKKVFLDKTAPIISLSGVEKSSVNNKEAGLRVKVNEKIYNLAEVTMSAKKTLDGSTADFNVGTFKCSAQETENQYPFTEDGIYEVTVDAKDKAGNKAEQQKIDFTVDATAPEIEINGTTEESYNANDVSIQIEVTESFYETNEVTVKATREIEGTTSPYEIGTYRNTGKISTLSHSFTQDGTYHIEVSAKDRAGNVAETKQLSFTVDKTAPEVIIEGIDNYHVTDKATAIVFGVTESFYDTDEVKVSVVREDVKGNKKAVPVAPFTNTGKISKATYEFAEEGIYTLLISALDKAGNEAKAEKVLTIDTSYPIINYMEEYDGKYLQAFQLNHKIDEMIQDFTIADYSMTLNGDLYDGTSLVKEEGKYLLKVEVTDEVAHKSEAQAEFIIDNTAPEIVFKGAADGDKSYEPINLGIKLGEENDTITSIKINGEKQTLPEKTNNYEKMLDIYDTYEIEVASIDYAQNQSVKNMTVKYSEKPFYVKLYENKPAFYGTVAAAGTLAVGGGIGIISGGFAFLAGKVTAVGASAAATSSGASGISVFKKIGRLVSKVLKR